MIHNCSGQIYIYIYTYWLGEVVVVGIGSNHDGAQLVPYGNSLFL